MINWKVRFKNPKWLVGFVSQLLIVAQMVIAGLNQAGVIHFEWSDQINNWVLGFVNVLLIVLGMLGVVQDPTTKGYSDSDNALTYEDPK
jgi:phi LC3 family holin